MIKIINSSFDFRKHYPDHYTLLLSFVKEASVVERNLFIFWNMLAITRQLIRKFIKFHSVNKYYDEIIGQRCIKDGAPR